MSGHFSRGNCFPYHLYRGYIHIPYDNYINSKIARSYQSIYNSGYMNNVYQNSYIMQSGVGVCTEPVGMGTTCRFPHPIIPPYPEPIPEPIPEPPPSESVSPFFT